MRSDSLSFSLLFPIRHKFITKEPTVSFHKTLLLNLSEKTILVVLTCVNWTTISYNIQGFVNLKLFFEGNLMKSMKG